MGNITISQTIRTIFETLQFPNLGNLSIFETLCHPDYTEFRKQWHDRFLYCMHRSMQKTLRSYFFKDQRVFGDIRKV